MPKLQLALEAGGPKRLHITWASAFKQLKVLLDEQPIGASAGPDALARGESFRLPDGSELSIRLQRVMGMPQLHVLRNGAPLPGAANDPVQQVRNASYLAYFVGGMTSALSALAVVMGGGFLERLGLGWGSLGEGVVYLILGYFISRRSRVALGLAMALYAVDTVLAIVERVGAGGAGVGGIVVRVVLFVIFVHGWRGMTELRRGASDQTATPPPAV